jgi:hypothetical protein
MTTPDTNKPTSSETPGQTKDVEIFVNSRSKTVTGKEISYTDVAKLAFADAFQNPNTVYTVTYTNAEGNKPAGSMVEGDTVKLKNGMHFNVAFTTRS